MRHRSNYFCSSLVLFLSLTATAIAFDETSGIHVCAKPGSERRIEVRFRGEGKAASCEVLVFVGADQFKAPRLLFHSQEPGGAKSCLTEAQRYQDKLKALGMTCKRQTAQDHSRASAEPKASEKLYAGSAYAPGSQRSPTAEEPADNVFGATHSKRSERGSFFDVGLTFTQASVQAANNGNASFASDAVCPGVSLAWRQAVGAGVSLFASGELDHIGYQTTASTGTFTAPSPWFWGLSAGVGYGAAKDLTVFADGAFKRRFYIYRASTSALGGDVGSVPEMDIGAKYRLPFTKQNGAYLKGAVGYLFAVPTQYSITHAGVSFQGALSWEPKPESFPLTLGLTVERALQNTDLVNESTWMIGLTLGLRFHTE